MNYLEGVNRSVFSADRETVLSWIATQERRNVSPNVIRDRLAVLMLFYQYLNEYHWRDIPTRIPLPVAVGRLGRAHPGTYPTYRRTRTVQYARDNGIRVRGRASPRQETPSEAEIDEMYMCVGADGARTAQRNRLFLDWVLQLLPRRRELLNIQLRDLPGREVAIRHVAEGTACVIQFVDMKGGATRTVNVRPSLILDTLDYVEGERKDIIARFTANNPRYTAPPHVFVSLKTGRRLVDNAATNILTKLMREAGASGHPNRIRAAGIINFAEALVNEELQRLGEGASPADLDIHAILFKLCEFTGHRHIESLRPYLAGAFQRRLQSDPHHELSDVNKELAARRRVLLSVEARIRNAAKLAKQP